MALTIIKWLIWLSALGFLMLVLIGTPLIAGSIGVMEVIVTLFVVGLMSVPGWIIHFIQIRRKRKHA